MKRISQSDLKSMYEPVPHSLEEDVNLVLSSLEDGEERSVVKKKISVSFILAAVIIIASMTAVAVSNMDLFWRMTHMAEPILPLEGVEKLVERKLGSVENEYVTLTVDEAIFDGRSVMTLVNITPKDTGKYAMLNAFMQSTPEEIYDTEICPVEVAQGTQGIEMDGVYYEIVNEENEKAFRIDGEDVEIPGSPEEAGELDMPVYMENGTMYETNVFDFEVTGRKDGKETIYWWLNTAIVDDGVQAEDADGSYTMDAEEQPDGSVLVWCDRGGKDALPDTVKIRVRCGITVDGQEIPMDDLIFEIGKVEMEKKFTLVPENGRINDYIEILSAEISLSKVRGYLTVDYLYDSADGERTDIFMHLKDADGEKIKDGSGWVHKLENGHYREMVEIQSFEDLPEALVIEAKAIDGDILGSCVCSVLKES